MKIIPAALGTADFGTALSQEDSWAVLDTYASLGGRIIDTANNYACWHPKGRGGDSERVIGDWLEKNDRGAFTVMTKIGSQPVVSEENGRSAEGLSRQAVFHAVDLSLARLKTDTIDILLAHHDDKNTPLRETWEAFTELVRSGRVKKIGVSNYQPERMVELATTIREYDLAPIDVVQLKYSALSPVTTADLGKIVLLDEAMKNTLRKFVPNATLFGFAVLLGGLFEKSVEGEWPQGYDSPENKKKVEMIQLQAKAQGVSPSAYVLKQIANEGILPIIATGKTDRLVSNMALF